MQLGRQGGVLDSPQGHFDSAAAGTGDGTNALCITAAPETT